MSKAFFIDTTLCTACRGCQVACKQWHDLPAEKTINRGTYENPADLSFNTYKLVRMREEVVDKKLNWFFFPEQCRHCIDPPCAATADDPSAIYVDKATGAVIYTANTSKLFAEDIIDSCPYNIPRKGPNGVLAKCDMCNDRVHNGLLPACVQTCPTGAMNFGDLEDMQALAKQRLAMVKKANPKAMLVDADALRVIYLITYAPSLIHDMVIAANDYRDITRKAALSRMARPFTNILRA